MPKNTDPPAASDRTLIQLEGGHTTVVARPINELAAEIQRARSERTAVPTVTLLFLQSGTHGDNGLVIDPEKVVALIKLSGMPTRGQRSSG